MSLYCISRSRKFLNEGEENFSIGRKVMLDCPTRILLLDEPRSDETPRVLTKRLLVALEFSENIFKYDPRSARDEHENLNPSVIRHPLEMSFKLPRTFYFFCGHTHILSHTWVYEYVLPVESSLASLRYATDFSTPRPSSREIPPPAQVRS